MTPVGDTADSSDVGGDAGLAASEEAVTIRQLAARWPAVYKPDLDQSMTVLTWPKDIGGEAERRGRA